MIPFMQTSVKETIDYLDSSIVLYSSWNVHIRKPSMSHILTVNLIMSAHRYLADMINSEQKMGPNWSFQRSHWKICLGHETRKRITSTYTVSK